MIRFSYRTIFQLKTLLMIVLVPAVCISGERQNIIGKDPLLNAMQAELRRAQKGLRLPDQPDPYFISFSADESAEVWISGKYGSITLSLHEPCPHRTAGVQVRVGNYSFDNTNLPLKYRFSMENPEEILDEANWDLSQLPMDEKEDSVRATFWLLADSAYKRAIADYQKKKVLLTTAVDTDKLDDFYKEPANRFLAPVKQISFDRGVWEDTIRTVTEKLAAKPWIVEPSMDYRAQRGAYYYVNTEGTVLRLSDVFYSVSLKAWSRSKDGARINNYRHFFVRDPNDLPDKGKLVEEAETLARELSELSVAEEFKPYSGPAILMPDAAGVFFHEALGHRLEGERQRDQDSGYTFKGKIGERILPDFLTVTDDPTLEGFRGKSLTGHYLYDDEGVASQKVTLVEKGVLKNYLISRTPVKGFTASNGHGRSQGSRMDSLFGNLVGRMANLKVESAKKLSYSKLKSALIEEARRQGKPYGLIIKRVSGGETNTRASSGLFGDSFQAFRATLMLVYTVDVNTGKEKLVRGVELVGTPLISLEKVIATGDDDEIYNAVCGAESGWIPVSVISPSILTAQVELQRTGGATKRPPILPSPFQSK